MSWIRTHTGRRFDYAALLRGEPVEIHLLDIAHALSRVCRFGGHVNLYCSVAEHSVRVMNRVREIHQERARVARTATSYEEPLRAALLHDAAEAYLGDMPSPLKALLGPYRTLEHNLEEQIGREFSFHPHASPDPGVAPAPWRAHLKQADREMLAVEMRDCVGHVHEGLPDAPPGYYAQGWTPERGREEFLAAADGLGLL